MSSSVGALFCLPQQDMVTRAQTPQGRWPRVTPQLMADPGGQINVQHGATLMVHFGSRDAHVVRGGCCGPSLQLDVCVAQSCLSLPSTVIRPKDTA